MHTAFAADQDLELSNGLKFCDALSLVVGEEVSALQYQSWRRY
jgi:hypothetical protein